jgi:hypothetical protein
MCDCKLLWKWWMKDGSVLLYQLRDLLLLDEKSEESAEHGWKLYLLLDDESDEFAEYGWKSIRLGRYTKYRSYIFLPALFIDLSSSEIQWIPWMEIQWMEIGFICCKIWVFKSSTLDGTNLAMWLNVLMSNIARSCWLSGR